MTTTCELLKQDVLRLAEGFALLRKGKPGMIIFEFVAKYGRTFDRGALTQEETQIVRRAAGRKHFRPKYCFNNAQRLVAADRSGLLHYVEGYATGVIPVHHGWVTINNKIVDPTPRLGLWKRLWGSIPEDIGYFGVVFPRSALSGLRDAWSLLDDMNNGWPYLTGKKTLEQTDGIHDQDQQQTTFHCGRRSARTGR